MLSEFDSNLNEIIDIKELADLMDAVDSEEDEQVIVKPIYVKNWFIKPIKSVFNQEWVRVEGVMVENDTILVTTGEICRVLSQNSIQDIHDQIYTLVGGMDLIANTLSESKYDFGSEFSNGFNVSTWKEDLVKILDRDKDILDLPCLLIMGRALLAPAAEAEYKRVAVKEGSLALVSNDEISTAETVHSPVLESSAPKNVKKKASGDVKANLKTATKKRSAPHEVYRPKKIDASGKRVKPPVVKPKAVVNPKPASNSNSKSKRILVSSDDEDDLVETKKSKVIEYVESPDPIRTSTRFGRSISKPVEWWKA